MTNPSQQTEARPGHTPTPWRIEKERLSPSVYEIVYDYSFDQPPALAAGIAMVSRYSEDYDPRFAVAHRANASLIVAAVNSYGGHCADPVAAAEADLLGEALAVLRDVATHFEFTDAPLGERARAVLAKSREVQP